MSSPRAGALVARVPGAIRPNALLHPMLTANVGALPIGISAMATTTSKSTEQKLNTYRSGPDEKGFFGLFGGRFVAETLMPLILDLEQAYEEARREPAFQAELTHLNAHYAGR